MGAAADYSACSCKQVVCMSMSVCFWEPQPKRSSSTAATCTCNHCRPPLDRPMPRLGLIYGAALLAPRADVVLALAAGPPLSWC